MTARDYYELIVGKGGISPEYFLYEMKWWEAFRFVIGMNKREHSLWETNRSLIHSISMMLCEKGKVPNDVREFWPLPWDDGGSEGSDNSEYDEQEVKEEYDRMMESMREHNQLVEIMRNGKP